MRIQTKTYTRTVSSAQVEDVGDFELSFPVADWMDQHIEVVGDKAVIGYLVSDSGCENPMTSNDGMGEFIRNRKGTTPMSLDFYLKRHEEIIFDANITHNLTRMADAAGIYGCLWRPDENDFHTAADVIPVLRAGLCKLVSDPAYYKKFDAENGWGLYVHFVPFCIEVLEACIANPDAEIEVSR